MHACICVTNERHTDALVTHTQVINPGFQTSMTDDRQCEGHGQKRKREKEKEKEKEKERESRRKKDGENRTKRLKGRNGDNREGVLPLTRGLHYASAKLFAASLRERE